MKASEALIISQKKADRQLIKSVFDQVNDAAIEGKVSIIIPFELQPLETSVFKVYGYQIDLDEETRETTISWQNAQ